jgi:hypothetical protein
MVDNGCLVALRVTNQKFLKKRAGCGGGACGPAEAGIRERSLVFEVRIKETREGACEILRD